MKKRMKKYRPRTVRTPDYLYRIAPEITEDGFMDLDLCAMVPLDAVSRGDGTVENVDMAQSAIVYGYVLSAAFEDKARLQLLFLLAFAGLNGARRCIQHGADIPPCIIEPARAALSVYADMMRQCDRQTLVRSARATQDYRGRIICIAEGAGWMLSPGEDEGGGILLEGRRGAVYINGKIRTGYAHWNAEMSRVEWIDPLDDTKVPILKDVLVLLAEPYKLKENEK